jgi:tRNA pseudouridine synthase 10
MKDFRKAKILRTASKVAAKGLCDNCLGRQVARVSTGLTNRERGEIVRKLLKIKKEPAKCPLCGNLFKELEKYAEEAAGKLKKIDFSSFLVGSRLSRELAGKEEELWEETGIEYCEPLKSELNRELGKLILKRTKKRFEAKNPDVTVILNLQKNKIELEIRPLFIYGKYQKLARGIPQTKWSTYKQTVEDIIAKPLMKASGASAHSLHGSGREDIDARCLDWRPFVFELKNPKKRNLPLRKMEQEINRSKKVKVRGLRFSDKKEVAKVKSLRQDKTYRVVVVLQKPPAKGGLEALKSLKGIINQKTPSRVLHRRADLLRKREVKSIKYRILSRKKVELEIRASAGLYIKELVTGDSGRTKPSVSEILGPARVKELDVVRIVPEKGGQDGKSKQRP